MNEQMESIVAAVFASVIMVLVHFLRSKLQEIARYKSEVDSLTYNFRLIHQKLEFQNYKNWLCQT